MEFFEAGEKLMIRQRLIPRELLAAEFLLIAVCMLTSCNSQATVSDANTPEIQFTASSTAVRIEKTDTPAESATRVPATATTTKIITPTPPPTDTTTAFPEPIGTPTATYTPVPATWKRLVEICGIDRSSTPQTRYEALYFRTFEGDWYRTVNGFATAEWVSPAGTLSPDLTTLVVFDCYGPGSICAASPPKSELQNLPLSYQPPECADTHSVHWLSGSRRLLFKTEYSLPGQDEMDFRLYLLDLDSTALYQLTDQLMPDSPWGVSPLETCVAYSAYDNQSEPARFRLVDVRTDNFESWFPQVDDVYTWPGGGDPLDWSPDGSSLAFSGMYPIIVWNLVADERMEYNIEDGQAFPSVLKWSPDGDSIYFVAPSTQGGTSHWLLNLSTGEYRDLAKTSVVASPNAYQWLRNGEEIIVPSVQGSLLLNVSDGSTRKLVYPGSEDSQNIADMFFGPSLP